MRGAVDNNVIVSGLLTYGAPSEAFDHLMDSGTILISIPVLLELAEVLNREKFDRYLTSNERLRFMARLLKKAEMVQIVDKVNVCRDPKDNKLLELAVNGRADYLITGDKDLLVLDPFRGVRILTPREFLEYERSN